MILFYDKMLAPAKKYSPTKIYITTVNPYDHWLKKLYIKHNKRTKEV